MLASVCQFNDILALVLLRVTPKQLQATERQVYVTRRCSVLAEDQYPIANTGESARGPLDKCADDRLILY